MSGGQLILAATPLGNILDASPRLKETLEQADLIAAEDTRRAKRLFADLNLEIKAPVISLFEENEIEKIPDIIEKANEFLLEGRTDLFQTVGSFVAHPPMGKWIIALGEQIFGLNSFGWRTGVAFMGTLLVLVTTRVAIRLLRSIWFGALAGFLLAIDGLAIANPRKIPAGILQGCQVKLPPNLDSGFRFLEILFLA